MKKNSAGIKLLSFLCSLISVLILSVSVVCASLLYTLQGSLSETELFDVPEKMGYADMVREDVQRSFEYLSLTSGIPEELTRSFLFEDVTDEDILLPIRQIFSEESLRHDTEKLTAAFVERVEIYAETLRESGQIELSDEEFEEMKASFPETASHYVQGFEAAVRLNGVYSVFGSLVSFVGRLTSLAVTAMGVLALISVLLLILIQRKKVFYWLYGGFAASALILFAPSLWYAKTEYILRFDIEPLYLKEYVNEIALSFFRNATEAGTLWLGVGIAFGVIGLVSALIKKSPTSEFGKESAV